MLCAMTNWSVSNMTLIILNSKCCRLACSKSCEFYLFGNKTEVFIRSVTLIRLSQDRVKGFTSCSIVGGCISTYCKCCNIHLKGKSDRVNYTFHMCGHKEVENCIVVKKPRSVSISSRFAIYFSLHSPCAGMGHGSG